MSKYCTRSHPHEHMDCCCSHKSEIAKLENVDVHSSERIAELEQQLSAMKQRSEAAEARIKASQEREPILYVTSYMANEYGIPEDSTLYAAPVIPPDVAELQRENAELTRKLAEQQALVKKLHGYAPASWLDDCSGAGFEELTKLLAEVKSKAVPEGWPIVPKEPT